MEQPDELESESVHSTGNGRENNVHSCLSKDLTWYDKWLLIPLVSDNEVKALVTLALSDSENHTGGVLGYVSCNNRNIKMHFSLEIDFQGHSQVDLEMIYSEGFLSKFCNLFFTGPETLYLLEKGHV